jgi:flagellar biosynthetic protein FlhB
MADDADEKTLDPTPRRRQQMREAGQVALSHELTSAAVLLGGLAVLIYTGGGMVEHLAQLLRDQLGGQGWSGWLGAPHSDSEQLVAQQWTELARGLARVLLPGLALLTVCAAGASLLQTRFLFLPNRAWGDLSRINPLAGWGRLFSLSSMSRLGTGLAKVSIIVAVAATCLVPRRHELLALGELDLPQLAAQAWQLCLDTCLKIGLAVAALAVLDYGYRRWKLERDARMTPQDLREEMRSMQGDPQLVARRRALHRQMAFDTQGIRQADVVVAAPGSVAVALRYDAATMRAPLVVAKAQGASSRRFRELAAEHQVPWLHMAELAQTLHAEAAVSRPIADKQFAQVAEALAMAYEKRKRSDLAAGKDRS